MTLEEAIEILTYHQEWREGKRDDMNYEPKELTKAIDVILNHLKLINKNG